MASLGWRYTATEYAARLDSACSSGILGYHGACVTRVGVLTMLRTPICALDSLTERSRRSSESRKAGSVVRLRFEGLVIRRDVAEWIMGSEETGIKATGCAGTT